MFKHTYVLAALVLVGVPLTAVGAQGWKTVQYNRQPMVDGTGRIVRQARPIGRFDRIEITGLANLEVRLGTAPTLSIEADDNLLERLTSRVEGGTLKLGTKGSYRTRTTPRIRVTVPNLRSVRTMGSGNLILEGVSNAELELTSQGSGDIRAAGRTRALDVKMQGSGNADLLRLSAGRVEVAVYGSGDAAVRADGALSASVFGSGTVRYYGRPTSIERQRFGSGRIIAGGGG